MDENSNVMIETPDSGSEPMVENPASSSDALDENLVSATGGSSEAVVENSVSVVKSARTRWLKNPSANRGGRPRKTLDLSKICARLQSDDPLRSIARSLGVTHSTVRLHLQRAGLKKGYW